MTIDQIRTFLEIAATGNFNRAAERLNVTQSTVSARIRSLEERLGRSLFARGRTGAELTRAGHQFHSYALNLQRMWQQAKEEIALPPGFQAALGLGAQVSLWERLIRPWIPWMRNQAADVMLRIEADYSPGLMRGLADGLLDVGVMYQPRATPGLEVEKLLEEKLVLVSTLRRTVTEDWVSGFVQVHWGEDFHAAYSAAFPDLPTPAVSVGLGAMGLAYILDNGGSGYFPLRVVRPLLADKRLFRVTRAPHFRRPAYLVYPQTSPNPELLDLALAGLRHIASLENER